MPLVFIFFPSSSFFSSSFLAKKKNVNFIKWLQVKVKENQILRLKSAIIFIFKFLYLNKWFLNKCLTFSPRKLKYQDSCSRFREPTMWSSKIATVFLSQIMEICPLGSFLLGALLHLRWSFYRDCGPCQMPSPSGREAGRPLWRSGWTSNTSDRLCGVDLEQGYLYMHMQYTRSILSLNSPVEKVRTEHLANPYDIQRCRIKCPQTFLKKYLQKP